MKKRILVIDDEKEIAETFAMALEDAGYEVTTAGSGIEAMDLFEKKKADLVFADLKMAGVADGITVIKDINKKAPLVPIFVVTGYTMEFLGALTEEIRKGLPVKVLQKPIALARIVEIANEALGGPEKRDK